MPRQARLDAPGALHHIMVRGINNSFIFEDEQDKERFLDRLGGNVTEGKCTVYAWVLMDNHVHLLFKSGRQGISDVMRRLLTWYAQYFNRRHGRSGHLFENRYKSILCDEESYLLALVRYIHLNPIRAKIVKGMDELDSYPWSGHRVIVGKRKEEWMDTETVLGRFGATKRKAIAGYRRFLQEEMGGKKSQELTGGGLVRSVGGWSQVVALRRRGEREEYDARILGGGEFVDTILREMEARELRQLKHRRSGKTIEKIMEEECKKRKTNPAELKSGSIRRQVSETRGVIALRSRDELGLSAAEIARHLGVSTSSITRAIERTEQRTKTNKHN
jgi:putative transposase